MLYKNKIFLTLLLVFLALIKILANNEKVGYNNYRENTIIIDTIKKSKDSLFYKKYLTSLNHYKKREYTQALKGSLSLYNQKHNKYKQLTAKLIADIYKKTNNYKKAIEYYKTTLKSLDRSHLVLDRKSRKNDSIEILFAKTYLQIGGTYQRLHIKESTKSKNKFYKKEYKDTAIIYYNKLSKLDTLNNKIFKFQAVSFYNLSGIYSQDSLFETAKKFALKSVNIYKKNNDNKNLSRSLSNLGSIFLSSKDFTKAKEYYSEGINLIKNDNSQAAIKLKANLYYNLAWAMRNLKDYKAYDYQERSYEIEDNQREKEIRRIIEEVTLKHKENLELQKVNLATAQRKLIEAEDNRTSLLFGALSLFVILISGVVVYNYKLRQKNLKLKLSENSLKQQQSFEKLKSDTQTKILNATIDAKESERKQIAEILHDNVSALLSSANMHLSATKKQFSYNTPQEIEKTQAIILEASQKVRDLSHNLISSILLKFGLEYALKDVVKKYSNSQLKFEISAQNINRYNQEFEIKIFNIIQELANNILKHSKASLAQIIIKQEKNQLTILVNDNGIGFNTSAVSIKNTGIGLNQIEARLEMMNGKLSINSVKDKGTRISITIPIQQQKPFKLSSVS